MRSNENPWLCKDGQKWKRKKEMRELYNGPHEVHLMTMQRATVCQDGANFYTERLETKGVGRESRLKYMLIPRQDWAVTSGQGYRTRGYPSRTTVLSICYRLQIGSSEFLLASSLRVGCICLVPGDIYGQGRWPYEQPFAEVEVGAADLSIPPIGLHRTDPRPKINHDCKSPFTALSSNHFNNK